MTQTLWTSRDAARATGGRVTAPWSATGVSIDSRTLEPGDLFVALRGPNFDGHRFAGDALAKGAAGVLVDHLPDELEGRTVPALVVDDTQAALEALGRAGRARTAARVLAITGSVGKTGTKEALRQCLGTQGKTHASVGSFNNHWGVPLSLARLPADAAYAIFELGMNHPGEIRALVAQVRPDAALITTIAPAHLGNFNSVDEIADAKAEILEGIVPGGVAVLNRDNPFFDRLNVAAEAAGVRRVIAFGEADGAQVRLLGCDLYAACSAVQADVRGKALDYCLALPGRHWVMNSLAVLAMVSAAGADVVRAAEEFARLRPAAGRGERHLIRTADGAIEVIDDSYNANPTSMRAAIDVLARAKRGGNRRRLAVLGDMLELGEHAARMHADLTAPLAEADVDLAFTCGPEMAALDAALPAERNGGHADDSEAVARLVAAAVRPGDTVPNQGLRRRPHGPGGRGAEGARHRRDERRRRQRDGGQRCCITS